MNDKKRIFILLKTLDQIRQDNEEARNGIERSIAIYRGYFVLKRYFIFCFFDAALVINHPSDFRVENLF